MGATEFTIIYNIIGNAFVIPSYGSWPTPPTALRVAHLANGGTTQTLTINASSTPAIQAGKWYIGVYGYANSTYTLKTLLTGPGPAPAISGTVYANDGVTPLAGATVTGTNSGGTATSAANGTYTLTVPHYWTGEVTATKGAGRFDPYPRSYSTIESDQTGQDFQGPLYELKIETERGDPRGEGWYPEGSTATWSVTSPEVEGPGVRHVPSQSGGEVVMNGPQTIEVDWVTQYRLETGVSPSGRGTIEPVSCWVVEGNYAEVSCAAASGSTFDAYQGDLTGSTTPQSLLMDAPKSVTAKFLTSPLPPPEPGVRKVPLEYGTIQAAIDAASEGDSVVVDPGTYNEVIHLDGKNITVRSLDPDDPSTVESTVINGASATPPASVVTFRGDEGSTCVLTGFTITGGRAFWGAGIIGNPSWDSEAGTHATIRKCIVRGNVAYVESAPPYRGGECGGILNCDGLIEDCTIQDNSTDYQGGGLTECDGQILRCQVSGNQIGGVFYSDARVSNCEIFENEGNGLEQCNGIIENSVVHDNQGAGMMACLNASVRNCVVYSNTTYQGAGIAYTLNEVINCTIYNNTNTGTSSNGAGAGLMGCTGVVKNNIVWGNHGATYGGWPAWNKQIWTSNYWSFKADYCCIQDIDTTESGNIYTDPQFVDREAFDLRLPSTSHCIDAGASVALSTDINGVARPYDGYTFGTRGDGSDFDMGAYEYAVLAAPGQPVMQAEPALTIGDTNMVAWSKVAQAASYEVQCDDDEDFSSVYGTQIVPVVSEDPATFDATFGDLGDVTYWYRVRALNAAGDPGSWSAPVHSLQDSSAPWFIGLTAEPSVARRGNYVTLTFTASEPLANDPVVEVNGLAAWKFSQIGQAYAFQCQLRADEAGGPAEISITGRDAAEMNGTMIDQSALTVDTRNATDSWALYQ